MGKGKGLAWLICGSLAFDVAARQLDMNGLTPWFVDTFIEPFGEPEILGSFVASMFRYFGDYCSEFFRDGSGYGALGAAGQLSMYLGSGNLIYNTIKRPKKENTEE